MFFRNTALAGIFCALAASAQTPPTAPRTDHREVRHGATVIDDYFWLREKSNPKVVDYLIDIKRQGHFVLPDLDRVGSVVQVAVDIGSCRAGSLAVANRVRTKAEKSLQPVEVAFQPQICDIIRAAIVVRNWHVINSGSDFG